MVDYGHVCIVYTRILGPYRFQGPLFDTENIIGCRTPAVDRHFGKLPNNSIGYKMSHRVMYIRFMGLAASYMLSISCLDPPTSEVYPSKPRRPQNLADLTGNESRGDRRNKRFAPSSKQGYAVYRGQKPLYFFYKQLCVWLLKEIDSDNVKYTHTSG